MSDQLAKMAEDLGYIKATVTEQNRRLESLEIGLKPVVAHVSRVDGIIKLLGGGSLLAMIITAVIETLSYFRH